MKKLVKSLCVSAVILAAVVVIASGLHVRVVTEMHDKVGHCNTVELHNGKINECEDIFYPYGLDHKVNVWFAL